MSKKLIIIGRGTAGAFTVAHFAKYLPQSVGISGEKWDIEWHYDPSIPTQAVGEGINLNPTRALNNTLGFEHFNLPEVDGTFKTGIFKKNWGKYSKEFFHTFPPPSVAYHFNALKIQDYVHNYFKNRNDVKIVESNTNASNMDADYIIDCSGRPANFDSSFRMADFIPVNSVHVTQCYWDRPEFQYSLTNAMQHGWYFGIPLQNRCSIGYLYNNNINTLEEIKEDVKSVFGEYNLTPSTTTNSFTFKNYYRVRNFENNIAYNGNSSFFLEPLEATTISTMVFVARLVYDKIVYNKPTDFLNAVYADTIESIGDIIMLHYYPKSKYGTKFWKHANELAEKRFDAIFSGQDQRPSVELLKHYIRRSVNMKEYHELPVDFVNGELLEYGTWSMKSIYQNIHGLGIADILKKKYDL